MGATVHPNTLGYVYGRRGHHKPMIVLYFLPPPPIKLYVWRVKCVVLYINTLRRLLQRVHS